MQTMRTRGLKPEGEVCDNTRICVSVNYKSTHRVVVQTFLGPPNLQAQCLKLELDLRRSEAVQLSGRV